MANYTPPLSLSTRHNYLERVENYAYLELGVTFRQNVQEGQSAFYPVWSRATIFTIDFDFLDSLSSQTVV